MWRWAKQSWHRIDEVFHSDLLRILVPIILGGLSTKSQLEDVKRFFSDRDTSLYSHILRQELERIEVRQRWVERDGDDLKGYLQSLDYLIGPSSPETPDCSLESKVTAGKGRNQSLSSLNQPVKVGA